jgi:glycogen synthase
MSRILAVLPYSRRTFGGGLAVFSAQLPKALAQEEYDVRLLTMELPAKCSPDPDEHKGVKILTIKNEESKAMVGPGSAAGEMDRSRLYELINSEQVLLSDDVKTLITEGRWSPDIIVGHSRFSGLAAILLKQKQFKQAKAAYFIHSIPVEGTVLKGYEAYLKTIQAGSAVKFTRSVAPDHSWAKTTLSTNRSQRCRVICSEACERL